MDRPFAVQRDLKAAVSPPLCAAERGQRRSVETLLDGVDGFFEPRVVVEAALAAAPAAGSVEELELAERPAIAVRFGPI